MKRLAVFFALVASASAADWHDEGVLYLNSSPHAVMHPVPVHAVTIGDGFWYARRKANVERSIPSMLQLLEENGVVDNFRRLSGRKNAPLRGPVYTDSDIYKWIEGAAFSLQTERNPALEKTIDGLVDDILAAQEPSGYLNTHLSGDRVKERFHGMTRNHELYCLGHMLQAGIAYYRATGNRRFLDGGIRFVDYLIANFGPAPKPPLLTGHPELELALAELYRTTGERKYIDLAGYLLSGQETERLHLRPSDITYLFSGIPFTSRTEFVGHAVRAMYASSGAADYYMETGDPAYWKTLQTLWSDMTRRKMYITGGVGSRSEGEAFGDPYELPNAQAYTESCAAIGNMMWNFRMLAATGDAKYADVMERALYNGINSGMSLDGTLYCYRNPLASSGEKIRNPWYDTTCCPPNIERTLSSLPGYFYATSKDGLWVHLYHNSELDWHLEDGTALRVKQETQYPWKGLVTMTLTPAQTAEFALHVRIPGWSRRNSVRVNGQTVTGVASGKYLTIRRSWKPGDRVTLDFSMTPELIASNPLVRENTGKVALERGPLVYCLEQPDQLAPVDDLALREASKPFAAEFDKDLLGGIVILKHEGEAFVKPLGDQPLYQPAALEKKPATKPLELRFIPYYAWANRGQHAMEVWVPLP
ncbi:MAG TPA: beta-L-arabinofuranosidase domain-containing protein [Bryobacteraceae bacterium]|jgi:DUF1680 family protein|nr:beta-L-arabinofuranosidase domain-containing protein [Bryobacteraceae bacterium]